MARTQRVVIAAQRDLRQQLLAQQRSQACPPAITARGAKPVLRKVGEVARPGGAPRPRRRGGRGGGGAGAGVGGGGGGGGG
ncbi:hypothetical protein, partial [Pseudomonas juntendi]|uniref:hypothetical protein n=1 Tax=Pseudomonas juntendi TaxID=2666183 RepID=UPI001E4E5C86